jgi:hypothetical protein
MKHHCISCQTLALFHDDLFLKNASECHHCQSIGHTRCQCKSKSPTQLRRNSTSEQLAMLEQELSECINTCVWEEKKQIQLEDEIAYLKNGSQLERFTRIECACMATMITNVPTDVSESTEGRLDHDETRATLAALS